MSERADKKLKLYIVTLSVEVVVVAESAMAASEMATKTDVTDGLSYESEATELRFIPAEWDLDSLPYGDVDEETHDRTIGEWIEAGAAPLYVDVNQTRRRVPPPVM